MKTIEILKNCFVPFQSIPKVSHTPTILKRGSVVRLEDEKADALIAKGCAAEKAEKKADEPAADEAPATKRSRKSKE